MQAVELLDDLHSATLAAYWTLKVIGVCAFMRAGSAVLAAGFGILAFVDQGASFVARHGRG